MRSRRIAAAAAAAVMTVTALGSCGTSMNKNNSSADSKQSESSSVTDSAESTSDSEGSGGDTAVPVYNETNFDAVTVPYVEYSKTYQAESGTLISDTASVKKERASFKGEGYVSGANQENWSMSFDLPESQFYNISIQTAADSAVNCRLFINGREVWIFRTAGDGNFSEKFLENIWLEKGINEITVQSTNDLVDIDYIKIESNADISTLNPDLSTAVLSNPHANYRAQALYQILCSNYGKQVLTAQHDTAGGSSETALVQQLTNKAPAIRVSDMGLYTKQNTKDVTQAINYFEAGGLVAYDWYWIDPSGDKNSDKFEVKDISFDIKKAIPETVEKPAQYPDDDGDGLPDTNAEPISPAASEPKYNVDEMSEWDTDTIEYYHNMGEITDECYYILNDIDKVSGKLSKLQEKGVPVLWRPLPVASNGLYWWGTDKESYKWLWQLMYKRMTNYHELNNLVWVWSAQNADWYVGNEYCDVLSVDVYTEGNRSGHINTLLFLNNLCKTKPLAMSECGNLPAVEAILQEKAFWAYTALWTEPYLSTEMGVYASDEDEKVKMAGRFTEYYNNNYTLTREELPDLVEVAKSIRAAKKAEKKAKKEAEKQNADSSETDESSVLDENYTDGGYYEKGYDQGYTDDGGYSDEYTDGGYYDDGTGYNY